MITRNQIRPYFKPALRRRNSARPHHVTGTGGVLLPTTPQVTGLQFTFTDEFFELAWTAVPNVSYYNVYKKIDNGAWFILIATTEIDIFDDAVEHGPTYYYRVAAVRGGIQGWPSTEISSIVE